MSTPLAFRAVARGLATGPMAGLGHSWLYLGKAREELRVRAIVNRQEVIKVDEQGVERVDVVMWGLVREDVVAATRAGVITTGDTFRDDEGRDWTVTNPLRTGGAQWRLDLIKLQEMQRRAPFVG